MFRNLFLIFGSAAIAGSVLFIGCSKKDDTASTKTATASFKVQLNNSSSVQIQSANSYAIATSLRAKLGGVDLLNECTNGAPPGNCLELGKNPDPDIWVNSGCNGDIAQCTTTNTEFFELIDPAAANTELNSQGRSIEVGTYTQVRIYLLNNDNGNAIECNTVANITRPAVPITVTLGTPMTVAEGDNVTVTLNYDPSALDCADPSTISNMFASMTATVTKN